MVTVTAVDVNPGPPVRIRYSIVTGRYLPITRSLLNPVYTIQPVVKPVALFVQPVVKPV